MRITLKKRKTYKTNSNKFIIKKILGGKYVAKYIKKLRTSNKCKYTNKDIPTSNKKPRLSRIYGKEIHHKIVKQKLLIKFLKTENKSLRID
ncbi:ribosomal protein L34 (nucleomorph) [Bigelowiella natans]|uniref:Ribosomal protein L34 n=1 Tax=Bigelowiella natans TaxID=227086 RepID=Q3LW25_BIGNA|nr:ribosomal protein L34 [Bigelowiella natans]ABA27340.1 ribosomal protein L34 [Bigelowiella natans]